MLCEADGVGAIYGIGEKTCAEYAKLGIISVGDLISYLPSGYVDRGEIRPIGEFAEGERAFVRAVAVNSGRTFYRGKQSITTIDFDSDGAHIKASFFNQPYRKNQICANSEYLLYGTLSKSGSTFLLSGAVCESVAKPQALKEGLCAVYPRVTGCTLSSRVIAKHIRLALSECEIEEYMPFWILSELNLPSRAEMLACLHFPNEDSELDAAQRRQLLEEFIGFALAAEKSRIALMAECADQLNASPEEFVSALPFSLTAAQERVLSEILADMKSGTAMNRLLCGDVGSGKTAVAVAAAYVCAKSGASAAICAPTEILARQHFEKYAEMLLGFGIKSALLYSGLSKKARAQELKKIADGTALVVFGTHALFSSDVQYYRLRFAAIDEQQRYGVGQRAALKKKGEGVHILVMSATPIPRTLALSLSRSLSVSRLDELPSGRLPIQTYSASAAMENRLYAFVKKHLDMGERAYIVCPAIDEPEMENVQSVYSQACEALSDYSVGMITGAMKEEAKNKAMREFAEGKTVVLIATSVIEVGIDVPEASIMWVKGSERFGLAQLHQLRGRVGRGKIQSYCILQTASRSDGVKNRLAVLKRTNDGYEIAKADLYQRGSGDLLGKRQSGEAGGLIAQAAENEELFLQAQKLAERLFVSSASRDRAFVERLANAGTSSLSGIVLN